MRRAAFLLSAASLALVAPPARAQQTVPLPARFVVGLDALMMDPRGAFGRNIDAGFGIGGHVIFRLDPRGFVALRADFAGAQYGSETTQFAYDDPFSGPIDLDVKTSNSMAWGTFGPELSAPLGPVRPYVNAAIGYTRFSTVSRLRGDGYDQNGNYQNNQELARRENQHDGVRATAAGAGAYVNVGPAQWLATLHLGARYHDGRTAEYLREGSIVDNDDGSISFVPLRSRTPYVTYQLGVSVAIPRRGKR